jgi:hypothetical protein
MNVQAWIAAVAVVIAAGGFIFSLFTRHVDQAQVEVRGWQRVAIYALLEEGGPQPFDTLKAAYLQKAQQLLSRKISKKEIQDDSLRRILLDLQKDGVVVRREDRAYEVQVKVALETWAYDEIKHMRLTRVLKPKILRLVERESDMHTAESLLRKLHEQGDKISFEDLDDVLYELRGYPRVIRSPSGKLRYKPPYDEEAEANAEGSKVRARELLTSIRPDEDDEEPTV